MKNLFKASLVLLSVSLVLTACGSPSNVTLSDTNDSTVFSSAGNIQGMQGKGGKFAKGTKDGFGEFAGITLTEEQKTALAALRPTEDQKDPTAMKTQMEAAQKAIKDAFLADSINRDDLKAKLNALHPAEPDFAKQADLMIKSYNILTAEQKATLEAKQQEMQAKFDQLKANVDSNKPQKVTPTDRSSGMVDKLATVISLTDAQKTSLKEAFAPPADTATDRATREAEMKANKDAINAAVKAGDTAKLTELLSANKKNSHLDKQIDTIVKVHGILNADQRAKIIDQLPLFGFGGKGGHGSFDKGGKFGGKHRGGPLNNQTTVPTQTQQI